MLYCIDYASTTYSMFALSLLSTTQCLHSAQCTQCFHIGSNMFGGSPGVMFYLIPKNKRTVFEGNKAETKRDKTMEN